MNKCDLVVTYYRQLPELLMAMQSWREAAPYINAIYIVNDEMWTRGDLNTLAQAWRGDVDGPAEFRLFGFEPLPKIHCLHHEHDGFGVCKSYNQGARASEAEYIFLTSADIYIPRETLPRLLEKADHFTLAGGPVHHIDPTERILDENGEPYDVIRYDRFAEKASHPFYQNRPWFYFRGPNRLYPRTTLLNIGGYDERFDERNYEDYDVLVRWTAHQRKWAYVPDAPVWHLGDPTGPGGANEKTPKLFPYRSAQLLANALAERFEYRYNFMSPLAPDPSCVNVGIDIMLPTQAPLWLPDGGVKLYKNYGITKMEFLDQHLEILEKKMAPDGELVLAPAHEHLSALLDRYGFVTTAYDDVDHIMEARING